MSDSDSPVPKIDNSFEEIRKSSESFRTIAEKMRQAAVIPQLGNYRFGDPVGGSLLEPVARRPTPIPVPHFPSAEETNEFQSAAVLMRAISNEALRWKAELPEGMRPAILAILYGGLQVNVESLSQVSFHGIKVVGTLGEASCSILAHQATIQLLCHAEPEQPGRTKNPIGFVWDGGSVSV